jgi:hypothetical protein
MQQPESPSTDSDRLLSTKELARFLNVSSMWVHTLRWQGRGPAYCHLSHNTIRYRMEDVRKWLDNYVQREGVIPRPRAYQKAKTRRVATKPRTAQRT